MTEAAPFITNAVATLTRAVTVHAEAAVQDCTFRERCKSTASLAARCFRLVHLSGFRGRCRKNGFAIASFAPFHNVFQIRESEL